MKIMKNEPLSQHTAFQVGGPAEKLIVLENAKDIASIRSEANGAIWILGYGTNCVVSDDGLPGTVVLMRDGPKPEIDDNIITMDGSTDWDAAVEFACSNGFWGIELMSGIPGNCGAALSGNIAAYGQAVSDTFFSAEAFNLKTGKFVELNKDDLGLAYRSSKLQTELKDLVVTKLSLKLSKSPTSNLEYASALKVAEQLGLPTDSLEGRRKIILETRGNAGSIYDESDPSRERTAGSFFKNPVVDEATALKLANFDETGKTHQEILEQNRIHGGNSFRASAAHVLLAAGFQRGQTWGQVRLHPKHVLKLENAGEAKAQEIYEVAQEIVKTVREKLGIELEIEARFVGQF